MLTPPRVEGTVTVAEDRRLSFAEFGTPNGRPVIWLHGTPGARRQIPQPARVAAEELDVRLIGIDRPGVGRSNAHLYRNVLDFVDDLEKAADRLGLDEFGLIGLSGGGPYLLAAAYAIPERVPAGAVLGGVAPTVGPDAVEGGVVALAARLQPALSRFRVPLAAGLGSLVWTLRPVATPCLALYALVQPEGDRRLLNRPEFRAMFIDDLVTGSRFGLRAPVYDIVLFGRDWGFSIRDVKVPIRWWHGAADHIVPLRHGEHCVSLLPDATLTVQHGESHLGGLGNAERILGDLMDAWDRRRSRPSGPRARTGVPRP